MTLTATSAAVAAAVAIGAVVTEAVTGNGACWLHSAMLGQA